MDNITKNNIRLLVVDDEEQICEYLTSYFKRRGYSVLTAASSEEALPIIKEQSPDLMLLDINLPKISGIELLKLVREFNNNIKVIMVSGYDTDFQNDPQFKGLGILEFICKPIALPELELTVKKAVE